MIRSLFAGVSGLRNHQVQMDVIGNNIANVNTVGFKAGRVTFQESLAEALREGMRPQGGRGGINPMQVGLGMTIGSIDSLFTQGNLESTGNVMDLAIQGDAFFIVNDGNRDYYTRAGNFSVDAVGNLVYAANGAKVQGKMADSNGNIISSAPITNMVLPFGQKAPAKATDLIQFSCNLNAESYAKAQILSASFATNASVTSSALTAPIDLTTANQLQITIDDDSGGTTTETLTLTANTYSSVSDVVAEINTQIGNNRYLAGEVVAEVVQSGGNEMIKIRTTDAGGSDTEITLGGTATTPLSLSTSQTTGTTAASSPNDLSFVSAAITDGDEIKISGTNPDGSSVTATYTYAAGDTIQDILDVINSAYSGVTASLESDGSVRLTDATAGDSESSINLTFVDNDSNSVVTIPSFTELVSGTDAGSHTTSIFAYDSKGNTHSVAVTFSNISTADEPNTWRWEATVDNGEVVPVGGNKGLLKFNSDGSLASFEVDDNLPLTFVADGADTVRITFNPGDIGALNGITQLSSPTTTVAKSQNGYGLGNLYNVSFDETGTITGSYTNGVTQTLGQLVLATFNNPAGLERVGDNMFQTSANSGDAVRGMAGTTIKSQVTSGALEMSNVDLAQEFTNMIVAQRGFQANARVITTADTLLDEIVRLKR